MAEGAAGGERARGGEFLQYLAAASPALAPAWPQPPPSLLCNAGRHQARFPPSRLGLRLLLAASPSRNAVLLTGAKSFRERGASKTAASPVRVSQRHDPVTWGFKGRGNGRAPAAGAKGTPPRGEGPSPSTGMRGTTVAPVVRAPGLRSTASFSYMHLHETPGSEGISKQWGG